MMTWGWSWGRPRMVRGAANSVPEPWWRSSWIKIRHLQQTGAGSLVLGAEVDYD